MGLYVSQGHYVDQAGRILKSPDSSVDHNKSRATQVLICSKDINHRFHTRKYIFWHLSDGQLCPTCKEGILIADKSEAYVKIEKKEEYDPVLCENVVNDYRSGMGLKEVGERSHLTYRIVRNILIAHNIPIRSQGAWARKLKTEE